MHDWYVSNKISQLFHFKKQVSCNCLVSFSQGSFDGSGCFVSKAAFLALSGNIYSSKYIFCVALSAPILIGVNEVMVASRWFFIGCSHHGMLDSKKQGNVCQFGK